MVLANKNEFDATVYLARFSQAYDQIHIPLSTMICVFGAISNVLNVIVLTRKNMRTPINTFLTGLSAAQFLLAANYLSLMAVEYFRLKCYNFSWSYFATTYRLVNVNLNVIFHTVAFAHTLAVALFRFVAMRWPLEANRLLFSRKLSFTCTALIWSIVPVLCIPVYLTSYVAAADDHSRICDFDGAYDLAYVQDTFLVSAVFWMFGIVLKLIPSLILAFLLISLIRSLQDMDHRRQTSLQRKISVLKGHNRPKTTHTLLAILILCFMVEFPHGILNLFTAVNGDWFRVKIYDQLGSFMEMLTLLYSSISFILYCTTSNDFLQTFKRLFLNTKVPVYILRKTSRNSSTASRVTITRFGPTKALETVTLIGDKSPYPTIVISPQ